MATGPSGVTSYAYDGLGRLTRVQQGGRETDFTYATDGTRQSKTNASGTVRYLVDRFSPLGVAEVLRESDATGATLRSYTYGTQLLSRTEVTGVSATYLLDGLGSTRGLTDASGALR